MGTLFDLLTYINCHVHHRLTDCAQQMNEKQRNTKMKHTRTQISSLSLSLSLLSLSSYEIDRTNESIQINERNSLEIHFCTTTTTSPKIVSNTESSTTNSRYVSVMFSSSNMHAHNTHKNTHIS